MPQAFSQNASVTSTSRLDQLVAEMSARVEAGEPVDINALTSGCPEFREQLEMLLPTLQAVVQLEHSAGSINSDATGMETGVNVDLRGGAEADGRITGVLGDFRIIGELGRGGMGVVYEAEQISLGRRVALKVLPFAAMLDTRRLERFRHEAHAAAMLRHPHIVTVYSVGCERGVHYYAMEYIEGLSLAEVVEKLRAAGDRPDFAKSAEQNGTVPLSQAADTAPVAALSTLRTTRPSDFFRSIARLGIQAAEALDYAHQMGVVHRDIKPSNLLLDASGKLWITDFGLAMTQTDAGLTMTGDLLGTLRYMSPEQAAGKRLPLDHRTDVYSLGVTLYELLVGRPAFDSTDRAELLRAISEVDPPPLRRLVSAVPADLETIVRKAMEKDSADRYSTASDMAADLGRFLENRPIVARPPSIASRARKWSRRNLAIVAVAVAALVLMVVGLSVSALLLNAKKNESEANLRLAASAVDQLLAEMGREAGTYGKLPQAERILDQAARFYQQLIEKSNDPAILLRAATASNHIGQLYRNELGRHEQAIQKHQAALTLLDLIETKQSNSEVLAARATAYDGLGSAYIGRIDQNYFHDAAIYLAQAYAILQQLVDSYPSNVEYRSELIGTLNCQAVMYMETRAHLDEAENTFRLILELSKGLPPRQLQAPKQLDIAAGVTCNLGTIAVERGRLTDAEPIFRNAIRMQEQVVALTPGNKHHEHDLYKFQWNLADLFVRQGRHVEANIAAKNLAQQYANRLQAHFDAADLLLRCAEITDPRELAGHLPLSDQYRNSARQLIVTADQANERSADTLAFFAWFLLTCRDKTFRDPARALAIADAGLSEVPRHGFLSEVRGIALYRLGQYEAAIKSLEPSAAPRRDVNIFKVLFLAMSHWQLGNQKEAREWYSRSANWFDSHQREQTSVYDIFAQAKGETLVEAKEILGIDASVPEELPHGVQTND